MAAKKPWFPFFAGDWLTDELVSVMSLAAQGAYIRLLAYHWREGSLPGDPDQLRRLVGATPEEWSEIWQQMLGAFREHAPGRLANPRMLEMLTGCSRDAHARSEHGKKAAKARWSQRVNAPSMPDPCPNMLPSESESESEPPPPLPSQPHPRRAHAREDVRSASPSAPDPNPSPEPIARTLHTDAELERRYARYSLDPEADDHDQAVLRRVLDFVTSDRLTGKPLHIRKRLKILDDLARFQTGIVFFACHAFAEDGHLDAGKDHHYLAGICDGSATSEFIEHQNAKRKDDHGIRTQNERASNNVAARNPAPIRDLLLPHLRGRSG